MTNARILNELGYLYRILDAGEKGYVVFAANVDNRGLKMLFKSYAQQRARFKIEILAEMWRLSGKANTHTGLHGAIRRGRINIFAALTINKEKREQAILKEILIGEKFTVRVYNRLLQQEFLPETLELFSRQLDEVRQAVDQISLMHGKEGKRLVLRLFDTERDAETALSDLREAGLQPETVLHLDLKRYVESYDGPSSIVSETVLSGTLGGAICGALVGGLAGLGVQTAGLAYLGALAGAYLAFAGFFVGALVGAMLAFAIGIGSYGEDAYLYEQSRQRGGILLITIVDALRAPEVGQIMTYVNLRAHARVDEVPA